MQSTLKTLLLAALLPLALQLHAQDVNVHIVCEGQTLQFTPESEYWGEPGWEYSPDSLVWETLELPDNQLYEMQPEQTGYYRLSVYDSACEESYYSEAQYIEVNMTPETSFTLHTAFLGGELPATIDPFMWVQSDDEIESVAFYVNDTTYYTDETSVVILNPGISFSVYASAIHVGTNCEIYSDTLEFSVTQPIINANAIFDITGNFNLADIIVQSSVDSVALQGNSNFTISYDQSMGLDFLYAHKTTFLEDSHIVAIKVVEPYSGFITLNNNHTATALVLTQSLLALHIWTNYSTLKEEVENHASYNALVDEVNNQINELGYLDFSNPVLDDLIEIISADILDLIDDGLLGGRSWSQYPLLNGLQDGSLEYDPNGTRPLYITRIYQDEEPVSGIKGMRLGPNEFDAFASSNQILINALLVSSPVLAGIISLIQQSSLDNYLASELITTDDLALDAAFAELQIRLVSGFGLGSSPEEATALTANKILITLQMALILGPSLIGEVAGSVFSLFSELETVIDLIGGDWSFSNILDAVVILVGAIAAISGSKFLAAVLLVYSAAKAAYSSALMFLAYANSYSDVRYFNTKIGGHLAGKLAFESNNSSSLTAIPGGMVQNMPLFYVTERRLVYRKPFLSDQLELVSETSPNPYLNQQLISLNASSLNTASLALNEGDPFEFGNFEGQSLDQENTLDWRLAWGAQPGSEVLLSLGLTHQGTPITIEGLDSQGQWTYTATVEEPMLEPVGNTDLFGAMDAYLEQPPKVRVTGATSSLAYNDIPLRWTVTEGGGVIRKTAPFDDTEASEIDHLTYTDTEMEQDGICAMDWKLGEEGEQALQVVLLNPETEAVSNLLTFNAGNICGDPFPATTIQGAYIVLPDSSGISLQWYPPENSTFCELEYYVMNSDDVQTVFVNESPLSPYILSENQVYPDTTYFWRVRCGCNEQPLITGSWSDWYEFNSQEIGTLGQQPPYPPGTVHCLPGGTPTEVVDVTSPTGRTWMNRNLGASQPADSINDPASYGDLYQWGRFSDGHQCRNSETTSSNATTAAPNQGNSWDGKFILEPSSPWDWLSFSSQNNNLWQGVNGINNPCPQGFRIPTEAELNTERLSWISNNSAGAFASPLKLPAAGSRNASSGSLSIAGSSGSYRSSTGSGPYARALHFASSNASMYVYGRAVGFSVRCLKD